MSLAGDGGSGEGDGLGYVVGRDFPILFGVGFFDERLVVAVDDVGGVASPTRSLAFVFVVGEVVADRGMPAQSKKLLTARRSLAWFRGDGRK